jgi:transketolase
VTGVAAADWNARYAGTTRDVYRRELVELASGDSRIFCLDSDMGGLEDGFQAVLPHQYVDLGIAEANMMGVAAGLAAAGKIPFVNTMAGFATTRACEQVKLDIAYHDLPVRIVVTHAGLSAGHYGPTHQSCEDLAIVRAIPNLTALVPADTAETERAIRAAVDWPGPVYVRLGRGPTPLVYEAEYDFRIGKAVLLRPGDDVAIVASGALPVTMALAARRELAESGVGAAVVNLHTLKPLDVDCLLAVSRGRAGVVTVEDHSVVGGVGGAVSEALGEHAPTRVLRVGVPDRFCTEVGPHDYLLERSGVCTGRVVEAALTLCGLRR